MRKSIAMKTLLRSPFKMLLTLSLMLIASFVLFSRISDYTVMVREIANAEDSYHGVAALDITSPILTYSDGNTVYAFAPDDKPWPDDKKLKEFSLLPGVTMADTRYMTAGLVEDYKRLDEEGGISSPTWQFVLEGDYVGYEEIQGSEEFIDLLFNNVTILAGDIALDSDGSIKIETIKIEEEQTEEIRKSGSYFGELPLTFFEGLEKGSKCLVTGYYDKASGQGLRMKSWDLNENAFSVLTVWEQIILKMQTFLIRKV